MNEWAAQPFVQDSPHSPALGHGTQPRVLATTSLRAPSHDSRFLQIRPPQQDTVHHMLPRWTLTCFITINFTTLWDKHYCPWIYRCGAEAHRECVRSLISRQNSDSTKGLFVQIPTAASRGQPPIAGGELSVLLVRGTGGKPNTSSHISPSSYRL